ncbi:MAG: hypothetical protein MHMPM18_001012 [Marteilia pararefringens]
MIDTQSQSAVSCNIDGISTAESRVCDMDETQLIAKLELMTSQIRRLEAENCLFQDAVRIKIAKGSKEQEEMKTKRHESSQNYTISQSISSYIQRDSHLNSSAQDSISLGSKKTMFGRKRSTNASNSISMSRRGVLKLNYKLNEDQRHEIAVEIVKHVAAELASVKKSQEQQIDAQRIAMESKKFENSKLEEFRRILEDSMNLQSNQ